MPMKYAIIADIHANLEAFQVVLEDIKQQKCTHVVCLGDVVGYGANPKECLDIVRGMNIPTVKGNHDEYIGLDEDPEGFNDAAAEAVSWSRAQLTDDDRKWLRDLKYQRLVANFTIVHATLDVPQRWGYVFEKLEAAASFTYQHTQLCFFWAYPCPGCLYSRHWGPGWDLFQISGRGREEVLRQRRQRWPAPRWQPEGGVCGLRHPTAADRAAAS